MMLITSDVFADARNTRTQTAGASDNQVNFNSGLRGLIERLDHLGIDQSIHFGNDSSMPPTLAVVNLSADQAGRGDRAGQTELPAACDRFVRCE